MCGIAGIFSYSGQSCIDSEILTAMRETMVHRGPDGGANWISSDHKVGLAHRRLSIIDLSTAASQPMCNEDESIWIAFNGEIYNHQPLRDELRAAGHRFRTDHSDTEVLVHGYEQWGMDGLLQRLNGDFTFAIWDGEKKSLWLARDRVGVKPAYFSMQDGLFLFASEIKAILAYPAVKRDIDPVAMYHYLSFLTTPAPLTMFKGIFKLPAGHYVRVEAGGGFSATRYWDAVPGAGISPEDVAGLSEKALEDFYVNGIRTRLDQAVERRMVADVPVGVFLSGGVDSSTNVALMSRYTERPLETFSVGFSDHVHLNELDYAKSIANKFSTNHHEILINEQDMVGYIDDLVHSQDEPIADWVCIPLYFVSKLAHDNGVKVVQVGEGSDEQFSGYASYMGYQRLYHRYWQPFRKLLPQAAQRGIASMALAAARHNPKLEIYADIIDRASRNREHFWSGATVFWESQKTKLINKSCIQVPEYARSLLDSGLLPQSYLQTDSFNIISSFLQCFDQKQPEQDALTRMIYNEFKLRLPELLLMRVDKIAMSVSLEARVPFLDHELVQFTMDIPEKWKTKGGEAKYLLKKAVEGLIPNEIIYRKKMGFGAPMSQWLKGDFGKHVKSSVLNSELMKRGYFNVSYIESMFHDHQNGKRDTSLYIWTLFNLTAWFDYWVNSN